MPEQRARRNMFPLLLSAREASHLLAVSERTLYSWTKSGKMHCIREGRMVRYDIEDLWEWIANGKHQQR
jgi:excisionase family DNA binding protein